MNLVFILDYPLLIYQLEINIRYTSLNWFDQLKKIYVSINLSIFISCYEQNYTSYVSSRFVDIFNTLKQVLVNKMKLRRLSHPPLVFYFTSCNILLVFERKTIKVNSPRLPLLTQYVIKWGLYSHLVWMEGNYLYKLRSQSGISDNVVFCLINEVIRYDNNASQPRSYVTNLY